MVQILFFPSQVVLSKNRLLVILSFLLKKKEVLISFEFLKYHPMIIILLKKKKKESEEIKYNIFFNIIMKLRLTIDRFLYSFVI
jgi:hypothetical protein